jgi:hypothetical protein
MTRRIVIFAALLASLAGCETDAAYIERLCRERGLQAGTTAYESCLAAERDWLQRERARQQREGMRGG